MNVNEFVYGKMVTMMRYLLVFLYIVSVSYGQTQPTGTIGRDFYIGILKTYDDFLSQFSILITSKTSGTATIYMPHLGVNTTRRFNQSLEYKVLGDTITKVNTTVERKGIHVTTDVDVSLVVIKYPYATWEGYLALPATMLSTKYVIASYDSSDSRHMSNFLILSVHDDTIIEIHVNSSIYSVSMDHLDTYLFRRDNDLSGAVVTSDKPIAVFSGHEVTTAPLHSGGAEHLLEQLLPVKHFAQEFIVPPTPPKSGFYTRVYSSVQNTTVIHSNTTRTKVIYLSKVGNFYEILSASDPMYVMADKPVQVVLYATGHTYKHDITGDTFMSTVPAISQFTDSYDFQVISSSDQFTHYLAITSRTKYVPGLRINGHELRNLCHTYHVSHVKSTFTVNVYNMSVGVYHLQHVQGKTFGAIQYGFSYFQAYGYSLGMNILNGRGVTCLDCKDMSHLYLCDTVTTCSGGQVCYVETYKTNGGQVKYNSGCVDSHQCSDWMHQKVKRSAECVHCCSSQLCNANGCGSQGLPSPDLRGPLCYDCSYVSNMQECKTVKLCAQDEVCSIEKYDWGGVYDHYTAKCHSMQCITHKRSSNQFVPSAKTTRSTPVCQNCCRSDLCNTNCNMTSQNGTGVAIIG